MKTIMAVFLLLVSTSLLAVGWGQPDCASSDNPRSCGGGNNQSATRGHNGNVTAVPEPGTLALIGLGAAGLVIARRRKR